MCVDVLKLARELPLSDERYWHGDLTLAARPAAAVLNSRQGRHPHGGEAWVRATIRAAAGLIDDEKVIVSSTGMVTWELAAWAASEALGNVVMIVPVPEGTIAEDAHLIAAKVLADFGLSNSDSLVMPFFVPPRGSEKLLWKARDGLILRNADRLAPVSIRDGGFLASCLRDPRIADKISTDWSVEHKPLVLPQQKIPDPAHVQRKLSGLNWDHVAHWTRMSDGPWPGESRADYFSALAGSRSGHYRSAEATLKRILDERRIRATGWRMPMNVEMVSFSALPPWEMVERMTWRKRYVRLNYEPWGIAIRRDALIELGGREVIYGDLAIRKQLSATDRMYFQKVSDHSDWENELEWRLRGDLALEPLSAGDVLVLVPDETARERIQPFSRFEVVALT
ncbi:hypothetical protein KQI52_06555 [bacterium]|nr:hypothetical protein [bacterium]